MMEKRIGKRGYIKLIIIAVMISLMLTGCLAKEDYEAYMAAAKKTEEITKGAESLSVTVEQKLNAKAFEKMSEEGGFDPRGLERIEFNMKGKYDQSLALGEYECYYYFNELGSDFDFYRLSDEELFIKLPLYDKYFEVSNVEGQSADSEAVMMLAENIQHEWHEMLTKENVFVGDKTTIQNEDGEVKATKFSIKPTTEQLVVIKNIFKESMIKNKEAFAKMAVSFMPRDMEMEEISPEDFAKMVELIMTNATVTSYEEIAYVDLDGYIIEESMVIGIEYQSEDIIFTEQKITVHATNWDIEQKQTFDFPEITDENSTPLEGYDFSQDFE